MRAAGAQQTDAVGVKPVALGTNYIVVNVRYMYRRVNCNLD